MGTKNRECSEPLTTILFAAELGLCGMVPPWKPPEFRYHHPSLILLSARPMLMIDPMLIR